MPLRIDVGACTHVGCVREDNEDAYRIERSLNLFVLSDGMGGAGHGEVASAETVATVTSHCRAAEKARLMPLLSKGRPDLSERTNRLVSAVTLANRTIFAAGSANADVRGMGATVVASWIDGQRMSLVHVGDSRAYLLRSGILQQLTNDHSLVAEQVRLGVLTAEQGSESSDQSVLLRAVGTAEEVAVDADEQVLIEGDVILLCSDGLTRMISDRQIADILTTSKPAQKAADLLVARANEQGGQDNVTVIVVRILGGIVSRLFG